MKFILFLILALTILGCEASHCRRGFIGSLGSVTAEVTAEKVKVEWGVNHLGWNWFILYRVIEINGKLQYTRLARIRNEHVGILTLNWAGEAEYLDKIPEQQKQPFWYVVFLLQYVDSREEWSIESNVVSPNQ